MFPEEPPNSKLEKIVKKLFALLRLAHKLSRFQGAWSDHVWVESSFCCFPWELVSFVCRREVASFDPRHVMCSPPIGKRIWVGGTTTTKKELEHLQFEVQLSWHSVSSCRNPRGRHCRPQFMPVRDKISHICSTLCPTMWQEYVMTRKVECIL